MEQYYVEGIIKRNARSNAEAVSIAVWAGGPEEAKREAGLKLGKVQWIEGPQITMLSEERRMRALGAPELFPLETTGATKKKK